MFSFEFSIVLASILAVLAIVFFMGKGKGIMDAFDGKRVQRKKRSKEDELRYQRVIGIFCLVLAINELLMAVVGNAYPVYTYIGIAITVADLVFVAVYLKKNFPD